MKKTLLTFFVMLFASMAIAQTAQLKLVSSKGYGASITFYPVPTTQGDKVTVDWGDGEKKEYAVNPQGWGSDKRVQGAVKGDTVLVYCDLTSLDIEDNALSYLELVNQKNLTTLKATKNNLTRDGFFLGASNKITFLDVSHNNLLNLNLFNQTALENVYANNNPELNTVVFPDELATLKQVNLANCDIVHFYPKKLTNLQTLDITNGSLSELELGENYPNLTTLKLGGNLSLSELDITKQAKLFDLDVSHTAITKLNTFSNKELVVLNVRHTEIKNLDLQNNKDLTTLDCGNTLITKLDVTMLPKISRLALDSTAIARLDLSKAVYLRDVNIRNTQIGFLDLHSCNVANLLSRLDLRDCPNFTPQTLNFLYYTMPALARKTWTTNLFLQGSNAETSDIDILNEDAENPYKPDVSGDGTAPMDSVAITAKTVDGGTYTLKQIGTSLDDESWTVVTHKVKPGYPISVTPKAEDGFYFVGVLVDGKEVNDTLIVVSKEATIEPIFRKGSSEKIITLTVLPNTEQSYFLAAKNADTDITVDWGNGTEETFTLNENAKSIEGVAKGTTITIKGAVTSANFDSFEGFGPENNITALDVTKNDVLESLSFSMNPITSIDLSSNTELKELNCAYAQLSNLDLSHNTKLVTLIAYGNKLTALDVKNASTLTTLNVKINKLTHLDLSGNPLLSAINVMSNQFATLNLHHQVALQTLEAQDNKFTTIDLTSNTALKNLSLSGNPLTTVDLKANKQLVSLNLDGCNVAVPDLRENTALQAINISHNGWDACALNDFYALLPEFTYNPDYTLVGNYSVWNEGNTHYGTKANAVEKSETTIATTKGWIVNAEGDGTGCEDVHVLVKTTGNGAVKLSVNGVEVPENGRVKRNSEVTVNATPTDGYKLTSMRLNGRSLPNGKFTATKSVTLVVTFSVPAGINGVENGVATATAGEGVIYFTTDATTQVSVYSSNGNTLFTGQVNGTETVSLPQGLYLVKMNNTVKKMLVK